MSILPQSLCGQEIVHSFVYPGQVICHKSESNKMYLIKLSIRQLWELLTKLFDLFNLRLNNGIEFLNQIISRFIFKLKFIHYCTSLNFVASETSCSDYLASETVNQFVFICPDLSNIFYRFTVFICQGLNNIYYRFNVFIC